MLTCAEMVGAARRFRAVALARWLSVGTILQTSAVLCAITLLGTAWLVPAVTNSLAAAEPVGTTTGKATTSRGARDEALHAIPLDKLPAETRGKVTAVLDDVSLYRRLPTQAVDCDADLFRFVMNNPDVMVNIWRVMGVTNVTMDRIDGTHFRCSDGDGTTAKVEVVFRGPQMQVIYAEGFYDGPLFPRSVRGTCVAVLQYNSVRKASGRYEETAQLDTFLHVDNVGIELLAKLFQGLVGKTIDHNFVETISFIGSMSRTAELNPRGMRRLTARLDHVDADRREQFTAVSDEVAAKMIDLKYSEEEENPPLTEVVQSSALDAPANKPNKR